MIQVEKMRREVRRDAAKFAVLVVIAAAAVFAAGVALGRFVLFHQ